jgi:hypothetical protein
LTADQAGVTLLILDNLHAPADAVALLARLPGGRVLITSRRATGWHSIATAVNLHVLGEDDAVELLTRIASAHTEASIEDTARLCRELGRLPLAIEQVGAYMAETGTSRRTVHVTDVETYIGQVWSPDVRPLAEEAWRCYNAGATRACIGATWTAVTADIITKLVRLADDGDTMAVPFRTASPRHKPKA